MQNLNWKWALTFLGQLGAGFALLFAGPQDAQQLGVMLIGGAFGQGVSAQMTAVR